MSWPRDELIQAHGGYEHQLEVPFQHIDAAGIVFFARIFDYMHDAYVGFLANCGEPLPRVIAEGVWIAPLVHAEADYLATLHFGDHLSVRLVRSEVRGSRYTIGYRLATAQKVVAIGHTTHVCVHAQTMQRAHLPDAVLDGLAGLV